MSDTDKIDFFGLLFFSKGWDYLNSKSFSLSDDTILLLLEIMEQENDVTNAGARFIDFLNKNPGSLAFGMKYLMFIAIEFMLDFAKDMKSVKSYDKNGQSKLFGELINRFKERMDKAK